MELVEIYNYAESKHIEICNFKMEELVSFSFPDVIAIDTSRIEDDATEKVHLAHEIGHCETGTFYDVKTPFQTRGRCEFQANRWAFRALIPKSDLMHAMRNLYITEVWELAEHFGVTEELILKAMDYYKYNN